MIRFFTIETCVGSCRLYYLFTVYISESLIVFSLTSSLRIDGIMNQIQNTPLSLYFVVLLFFSSHFVRSI